MLFSVLEIFDIVVMSLIIGYIFKDFMPNKFNSTLSSGHISGSKTKKNKSFGEQYNLPNEFSQYDLSRNPVHRHGHNDLIGVFYCFPYVFNK